MSPGLSPRALAASRSAFTLVELIATLAIIAVLAALFWPAFDDMLKRARTAEGIGKLKTIGAATALYVGDHGSYPKAWTQDEGGNLNGNVFGFLAPYMGITTGNEEQPWDFIHAAGRSKAWVCPNTEPEFLPAGVSVPDFTYSGNPFIFSRHWNPAVRPAMVREPSRIVLFADASTNNQWGNASSRFELRHFSPAEPAAKSPVSTEAYGNSPHESLRFRQGKSTPNTPGSINAVFADGHAATIPHGELRNENFVIDY